MEVLDTTIVNVALPHIAGSMSASADEATWALTSYLVANGIVLDHFRLARRSFGAQTLFSHLHRHVHRLLLPVRVGDQPEPTHRLPAGAGIFRRRHAAQPAVDHSRHLSARPARRGLRRRGHGHHRRAGARPDARRLHHRRGLLALDLLPQRAGRHCRGLPCLGSGRGPAVGQGAPAAAASITSAWA